MSSRAQELADGMCAEPHSYLGAHPAPGGVVVRAFQPHAATGFVVFEDGRRTAFTTRSREGVFELFVPGGALPLRYRLAFEGVMGTWETGDPYRFLPSVPDADLDRFSAGTHERPWQLLGAHAATYEGEQGIRFLVWAPNARSVSLVGPFNGWDKRTHPLRTMGRSGTWELFVPGMAPGTLYKFAVRGADGIVREKSDPFGRWFEMRPKSSTIVEDSQYRWNDAQWMESRAARNPYHSPMSVYEVHLGSWRRTDDGRWLTYPELAEQLAGYVADMGYTHVELLPVCEHPHDGSWGYQVTGFYAPTSRFGTPDEFRAFVDRLHQAGIGVLVDWVPAHFATDAYGLERFDGTALYEHEDERRRVQPDWGTYSFNYARTEVRSFLLGSARYWLEEFHIDGLRVDAVSSMVYLDYSRATGQWEPNVFGGREHLEAVDLLKDMNRDVYGATAGAITVAEESTAWPGVSRPVDEGGLGFGFKWNMGWMHDTLEYFKKDPLYRRHHQGMLTFSMVYAYSENYVLSISHDEVVHGKASLLHKMPGDEWQQFANLRLLYAYQYAFPGKKLLFMGSEFGQRSEWNHGSSLEWHALDYGPHRQLQDLVRELNRLHRDRPELYELDHEARGFSWLDFQDADNSVLAFARNASGEHHNIVCVFNFTPVTQHGYRVPVPRPGRYRTVLNTDNAAFGGSGVEPGTAVSEYVPWGTQHHSIVVTLPPLAGLYLEWDGA